MDTQISWLFGLILFFVFSCANSKRTQVEEMTKKPDCGLPLVNESIFEPQKETRKIIVYKSKKDYSTFVPIHLAEDKKNIIGYPAKEDLKSLDNSNALAVENGYYIDLVGVNLNTVFTSYTLESYQKINNLTLEEFKNHIIELNPFEEMYICDSRYSYKEIEQFIKKGTLNTNCTKIK
jgi:hypothetical protein